MNKTNHTITYRVCVYLKKRCNCVTYHLEGFQ